jgi:hypothetical protein
METPKPKRGVVPGPPEEVDEWDDVEKCEAGGVAATAKRGGRGVDMGLGRAAAPAPALRRPELGAKPALEAETEAAPVGVKTSSGTMSMPESSGEAVGGCRC